MEAKALLSNFSTPSQMSSKIHPCNLPIFHKLPTTSSPRLTSLISSRISSKRYSSSSSAYQQKSISHATQPSSSYNVKFQTLEECKLGISRYPDFTYNAKGGVGVGTATRTVEDDEDETLSVSFDVGTLYIPPLTSSTTKFIGLPLPPFLKIEIVPELFQGTISRGSGKVELEFRAKFWFSAGSVYRAPPLMVETTLTSEESAGTMRKGRGKRLMDGGQCTLVGVAVIDPIDDVLMNSFLGLPTECIAVLNANISLS